MPNRGVIGLILLCLVLPAVGAEMVLQKDWRLQEAARVTAPGEVISTPEFYPGGWYPAHVPSTVMSVLVDNDLYPDIFFADRLAKVDTAPFRRPWWYRTEFRLADTEWQAALLQFDGLIYRADIWLNGRRIAAADTTFGTFRRFEFPVGEVLRRDGVNVLAVCVHPPQPGDFNIGFVDWIPRPPDENMGIWRNVRLQLSGPVMLRFPCVRSRVDTATLRRADLTVSVEAHNTSAAALNGVLEVRCAGFTLRRPVGLKPGEKRLVTLTPGENPALRLRDPRLWWTHNLGKPELYTMEMDFLLDGKPSDRTRLRFGVRQVADYVNEQGHRGYILNGKKVLISGAGWSDTIFLDQAHTDLRAQVLYARHMNLNTLRLEDFWGNDETLYDLCDEYGILLMPGWSAHWEWKNYLGKPVDETYGGAVSPADIELLARYWHDQVKWLRNHPSIFVWLGASDLVPHPQLEKRYLDILRELDPGRPYLTSAGTKKSPLLGPSGVKMNGPYDYVPPVYWYLDTQRGGAFGFNTETGPGAQVPPLSSLRRMLPAAALWPINELWHFHCCRGEFANLNYYNEVLTRRLGAAAGPEEYCRKAQFINYEAMRAMFEAFTARKPRTTGIIQWMYNSAWPKMWWQLFDYYLQPTGAFYGTRLANEPLHLSYDYGAHAVNAVNNTHTPAVGLHAEVRVLDFSLRERFARTLPLDLAADEARRLLELPPPRDFSPCYFLSLRLTDAAGAVVGRNFYALAVKTDTLEWEKSQWYGTPIRDFADLTQLDSLPPARVRLSTEFLTAGETGRAVVRLENTGTTLAFFLELRLCGKRGGAPVLPVFWDDNYITLLPGESRTLNVEYRRADLAGDEPAVSVEGWNTAVPERSPQQ